MIYLDTSVALAHLMAEDQTPAGWIWGETLIASRLLEYEIYNRLNANDLAISHGEAAAALIGQVALLALSGPVLARALETFPVPVRTRDALHLASADFLRQSGQRILLASYDQRMLSAATAMDFAIADI